MSDPIWPVELILDRIDELAALPHGETRALPPSAYLSEDLHAFEKERIFARDWICLGRAEEIPKTGDYLTGMINDQPIFAIRGRDSGVRAFANVCLHRMMRLLQGRGSCRGITCPYHGWAYGIDGQLKGAPHMQDRADFNPKGMSLPEIRTDVWEGWIYVTLDPKTVSISEQLEPLREVVGRYRMGDYVQLVTQDHLWNTNWKLLTENFMEGYHLPVAHKATVGAWTPPDQCEFPGDVHEAFTYQLFQKTGDAKLGTAHPDNTRLEGPWRTTSVLPTVFPTHMTVLAPDHLWYLILRPEGPGQVHVRFGAAIAPEVLAATSDLEAFREEVIGFFDRVNEEDRFVVEGIYEGARAPLSEAGPLSWLERELHDFQKYLSRRLSGYAARKPKTRTHKPGKRKARQTKVA